MGNIPNLCTHVIYAFATLDPTTYTMAAYDISLDLASGLGNYAKFAALKVVKMKLAQNVVVFKLI